MIARHAFAALATVAFLACASSAPPQHLAHDVEMPFALVQNHIYLPVSIGTHPPSSFLLDTGAGATILAQSTAEAMGLKVRGKSRATGAGPGVVDTTILRDVDIHFGGISVELDRVAALPLTPLSLIEGRAIEGVIGFNVIEQYVIEIDYARRVLRFRDPASFVSPADAVVVPIGFSRNHPVVDASMTLPNGTVLPLRMMVDTGARSAIVINRPFAEAHGVYDAVRPAIEGSFGAGVGGFTTQRIGRVQRFTLGGFAFESPLVSVSRDRQGAGADTQVDGLVGGELLRRFTLTIDYSRRRLLLQPNGDLPEPFEFDMGGVFLKSADTSFNRTVVRQLLPDSPATEAGMQVGDEIVSIDGRLASEMTIDTIRHLLRQPGRRYELRLMRSGEEVRAMLVTRRLL